jgi:hypothetical protein
MGESANGHDPPGRQNRADDDLDEDGLDPVYTTAADVESAGRSCMAILVLVGLIVVIIGVWLVYRATAGGQ